MLGFKGESGELDKRGNMNRLILIIILMFSTVANAGEFGVAEFEPYIKAKEGEIYVALLETTYSITKTRTQATVDILIHDHLHKPVEGVKVIVEWSTRNGKTNYCTTKANGKCTLRNKTATTRKPTPMRAACSAAAESYRARWTWVSTWRGRSSASRVRASGS